MGEDSCELTQEEHEALRDAFRKYCRYGSLSKSDSLRTFALTEPKFLKLMNDLDIKDDLLQDIYGSISKSSGMTFLEFMEAIGLVAVSVFHDSFDEAVHKLIHRVIRLSKPNSKASEHKKTFVQVSIEESDIVDETKSDDSESLVVSVEVTEGCSVESTSDPTEAISTPLLSLCPSTWSSTTGTMQTLRSEDLPTNLTNSTGTLHSVGTNMQPMTSKTLSCDAINLPKADLLVLQQVYDSYSLHWCSGSQIKSKVRVRRGDEDKFLVRSYSYGNKEQFTVPLLGQTAMHNECSLIKVIRTFQWCTSMCFGGFKQFLMDFALCDMKSKAVVHSFATAIMLKNGASQSYENQMTEEPLLNEEIVSKYRISFPQFLSALTGLSSYISNEDSFQARNIQLFRRIIDTRHQMNNIQDCSVDCDRNSRCSCFSPMNLVCMDMSLVPTECKCDNGAVALMKRVESVLRDIFLYYSIHSSPDPCRGGSRCGGATPLMNENGFVKMVSEFDFIPHFLSKKRTRELFKKFADENGNCRLPSLAPCLMQFALTGLSKYPYNQVLTTARDKIELLLKRMQASKGMFIVFGSNMFPSLLVVKSDIQIDTEQVVSHRFTTMVELNMNSGTLEFESSISLNSPVKSLGCSVEKALSEMSLTDAVAGLDFFDDLRSKYGISKEVNSIKPSKEVCTRQPAVQPPQPVPKSLYERCLNETKSKPYKSKKSILKKVHRQVSRAPVKSLFTGRNHGKPNNSKPCPSKDIIPEAIASIEKRIQILSEISEQFEPEIISTQPLSSISS